MFFSRCVFFSSFDEALEHELMLLVQTEESRSPAGIIAISGPADCKLFPTSPTCMRISAGIIQRTRHVVARGGVAWRGVARPFRSARHKLRSVAGV